MSNPKKGTTKKFNGRSYKISPLKEGPYKKGLVKNLMKARREVKVALNKKDKALERKARRRCINLKKS